MTSYFIFTADDAIAYARQHGRCSDPTELVSAQEVGDGNLNLVFKIFDTQGVSRVIVKQALPYVRVVGESWPLTIDRARLEAETLREHFKHSPQHTVEVYHFDPDLAVIVMEDLSDHQIWRGELIKGITYPQAAQQLGHYLARVLFYTSDFYSDPHQKKAQVAALINPEMCEITEDLFFNDPYQVHERNQYAPELEPEVTALRQDSELKAAVADLKYRFFSHAEALLHGDLHSGSIFVKTESLKVIDAEFGYYGPMGFDSGTVIANLLLNYWGLAGLVDDSSRLESVRAQRLSEIETFWESFARAFTELAEQETRDTALAALGYPALFLSKVWRDTIGFCGTELIRRSIGLAHVADLDSIPQEAMRHQCLRDAIRSGQYLITHADELPTVKHLNQAIEAMRS